MTTSPAVRPLYIDGRWIETEQALTVEDPATGVGWTRVATVGRAEVAAAFEAAHRAFGPWRERPARDRGALLQKLADLVERDADLLARTITRENGKPLLQSRGEVAMTADHLRWFAEEGKRAYGRVIPPQTPGKRHLVLKSPVGPVGIIAPWNFPLVLIVRKAAAALAAGCPVVVKPAPQTPVSALEFARLCHEAELPPGLVQVVLGPAEEIGREMLENPRCRKISFTGSTAVGKQLIAGAAASVKRLSLELGGQAPLLVFEDADLEAAVEGTLIAKFRNAGQSCVAANRIFVQRAIHDRFCARFVERVRGLKVGPGTEAGVEVGPLVDERAVEKAARHVDQAVACGARLLVGGTRVAGPGHFFAPTVLADPPADALCMTEETFAPVAPVCAFDNEAEVIARANGSVYGLAAYLFTRDAGRIFRLAEALEAGTIAVNDGVPATSNAPFGGLKQSGWGRELGSEGLEAFLETKHVSMVVG